MIATRLPTTSGMGPDGRRRVFCYKESVPARSAIPRPPAYPITAVDNALQALELVKNQHTIRITDLSRSLGIARSSAHRLLAALAYRGYVRQDPSSKTYGPGPALVELGLSVVREMDVRTAARPLMERLARETSETASLLILNDRRVLFVDCVEGPQSVRVSSRTGLAMPAHCASAGKAMLATLPSERLRSLYPKARLETMTDRSIASFTALEAELSQIRRRGYATNFLESEEDIVAVGVALPTALGAVTAGISVAGPAARLSRARVHKIAAALKRAAADFPSP